MDKDFARKLVKDTLQHSFEKERFTYLVKNLLNKIEETPQTVYRGKYIPEAYKDYISTLDRIGKYEDMQGKKLDILIVHLKKTTSLERARTMQRNFIAWYLNGSRGGVLKDAALAAFVAPGEDDWRFSFIKMEYKLAETLKGKLKAKEELTPARRYSFLVGKNENSHTAQSRLVPLLVEDEHNPSLKELEDSFGIEKVTKEFFEKYRQLFLNLREALDEVVKKDKKIKADFEAKNVDTVDFAKKLLGQIVFLYFLQKKGWFGVKRGQPWGKGSKHFLRELFTKRHSDYENFFNDILEPLFYEALRLERPDDYYSRFDCRIPFLNGGLFDPINDYDWIDTDILLPNDLFSNEQKTKEGDTGTGILDVFDRYNFTVKEDEPLEKEVAVDPEMLGKVFENLLEVKDRKSKGTYYTPREIVHYMCQQSLINYLDTAINTAKKPVIPEKPVQKKFFGPEEAKQKSLATEQYDYIVPKEDIELFVKYGDSRIENEIIARQKIENIKNGKQKTSTYKLSLPKSIYKNAENIDGVLKTIRVCDPAVGSGAFLVGMMHEIVNARTVLSACLGKGESRTAYDFKRDAIQSCLYGVDIDAGAVEIAKLRLWLSLVVDEEERKTIKPLPNLDYKIVCGNSLLGVQRNLENWQDFSELERLKPLFFNETNARKKQEYKQQIDQIIAKVTKGHTEFDFNIYFSEVFHEKKGFDAVIGNPPYVRQEKLKSQKKLIAQQFHTYSGTADIYVYFYEKGIKLLKPGGTIAYISSNKFFRAGYGKKLRKFLADKVTIINLIDFGDLPVFEATTYPCVLVARKLNGKSRETLIRAITIESKDELKHFEDVFRTKAKEISQSSLSIEGWRIEEQAVIVLLEKIKKTGVPLSVYVNGKMYRGITTGCNKAFVIDEETKTRLIKKDKKSAKVIKPFLRGRDVKRYAIKEPGLYLLFVPWHFPLHEDSSITGASLKAEKALKAEYPAIYEHLFQFKGVLEKRNVDETGIRYEWYALQRCAASYWQEFEKPKILLQGLMIQPTFALSLGGHYLNAPANFIVSGEPYLLGLLNSKLLWFFHKNLTISVQQGFLRIYVYNLEKLPIADIPSKGKQPIVGLVNKILAITKDDDYLDNPTKQAKVKELEEQIDQMVYKLYGLTDKEIAIVEGRGDDN